MRALIAVLVLWASAAFGQVAAIPCVKSGECTVSTLTTTGQILASDGSAAAPSFSNLGDADTGIYFGEDNGIYFSSAATLRWRIVGGNLTGSAGDLTVAGGITSTAATVDVTAMAVASRACISLSGTAIGSDCTAGIKQDATGRPVIRLNGNNIAAFAAAEVTLSGGIVAAGGFSGVTKLSHTPQAVTGTDTGDANPRAISLAPTSSVVHITCNDADTCDVTMDETGAVSGTQHRIYNISAANVVDFADTAGVSELAGAFAAGTQDYICVEYVVDRFVECGRSNN